MTDEVYIRETGVEDCEYLEVCEHACRTWCRSYKPRVDRDALLALAEKLDGLGLSGFSSGWSSGAVNVGLFARRIREALGAQDA